MKRYNLSIEIDDDGGMKADATIEGLTNTEVLITLELYRDALKKDLLNRDKRNEKEI